MIACALLMAMASAQVIRDSGVVLYEYLSEGAVRPVSLTGIDQWLLGATIALKGALTVYCVLVGRRTQNVTVEAVAQDHLNDVLSNSGALATAVLTTINPRCARRRGASAARARQKSDARARI